MKLSLTNTSVSCNQCPLASTYTPPKSLCPSSFAKQDQLRTKVLHSRHLIPLLTKIENEITNTAF